MPISLRREFFCFPPGGKKKQQAPLGGACCSFFVQFVVWSYINGKNVVEPFAESGVPISKSYLESSFRQQFCQSLFVHKHRFIHMLVSVIGNDKGMASFRLQVFQYMKTIITLLKYFGKGIHAGNGDNGIAEGVICVNGFFLTLSDIAHGKVIPFLVTIKTSVAPAPAPVLESVSQCVARRFNLIIGREVVVLIFLLAVFVYLRPVQPDAEPEQVPAVVVEGDQDSAGTGKGPFAGRPLIKTWNSFQGTKFFYKALCNGLPGEAATGVAACRGEGADEGF